MRILKIRGENLASLADEFTIDLTAEPLRSAGLFAITGKTGAGKSTILDAMCLALYGTCPRLKEVGVDDNIIDISGDRIKSSDPRSVMRTGAIYAWAEVHFTGQDGNDYLARWTVRRARGKDNGRLQPVERCLMDIAQDRVLEDQTLAVNARVAEVVGLSYDEFRRTVLLPQGEFDAFLQANTGKRAAILEKVTGTEIYRRISRRIYARSSEVRQEVATLEARRGEHRVLTSDERQNILGQIEEITSGVTANQIKHDDLLIKEARLKEINQLRERVVMAKAAEDIAEQRYAEGAPTRQRIADYDRAVPLKPLMDAAIRAEASSDGAELAKKLVECEEAQAKIKADEASANAEKVETARKLVDQRLAELTPVWQQAAQLDARVDLLSSQQKEASAAFDVAMDEYRKLEGDHNALTERLEAAIRVRKDLAALIEQKAQFGKLHKIWPATKGLMSKRSEEIFALSKLSELVELRKRDVSHAKSRMAKIDATICELKSSGEELDGIIARTSVRIREIQEARPGAERDELRSLAARLRELEGLYAHKDLHSVELSEARDRKSSAEAALTICRDLISAAVGKRDTIQFEVVSIEAPTLRLEAAASEAAAALRKHLHTGEPCPVCASKEHPVLHAGDFSLIARQMRDRLDSLRRELKVLEQTEISLTADATRQATHAEAAQKDADKLLVRLAEINSKIEASLAACLKIGVASAYPSLALGAEGLKKAIAEVELRIAVCSQEIEADLILSKEQKASEDRSKQLRERLGAAMASYGEAKLDLQRAESECQYLAQEISRHEHLISSIDKDLEPALALVGCGLNDLNEEGLFERLQLEMCWWEDKIARLAQAEAEQREIEPGLAAAIARLNQKLEELEKAKTRKEVAQTVLDLAREERSGLLDGIPTQEHKKQWDERVERLRISLQKTQGAVLETRTQLTQAIERTRAARAEAVRTLEAAREARSKLEAAINEAGLTSEQAEAAQKQPGLTIETLRQQQQALSQEVNRTRTAREEREADMAAFPAAFIPVETEAELVAAISDTKRALSDASQTIGALQNRLEMDKKARGSLGDLDALIDKASYERETWDAVNAAVGQENGNKFAQFAQSVTLGILIERANLHLRRFNPRYHLDHGGDDLSIQVVDNHMAGERRSTNSISGGERFLVSLSLALALSGLGGNGGLAGTIFIDEGFGSLDADSLDIAFRALEQLQSEGRTVGIISHVEAMKEHIGVKVEVRKVARDRSKVRVTA